MQFSGTMPEHYHIALRQRAYHIMYRYLDINTPISYWSTRWHIGLFTV